MEYFLRNSLLLFLLGSITISGKAQCTQVAPLVFNNPSFEGTPAANYSPPPWLECMPGQSPDLQPGSWGVTLPASDGSTYMGLVAQPGADWQEGVSQQLNTPVVAGITYSFTVDLANSSSTSGGIDPGCAECEIWGGFGECDADTLLWHSGNIMPYDTWQTDSVIFTATQNFTWIMFRVNSLGCSSEPYILVDNIRSSTASFLVANVHVVSNDLCSGDSTGKVIAYGVGQNPPFNYTWSNPSFVTADSVISNAPAGTYTVTVTDANACTSTAVVTISQPAPIVLTPTLIQPTCIMNTGSAYMSYAGGTTPMTFIWNNGDTMQSNPNLFAGLYNITVTDANGCKDTAGITINPATGLTLTGNVTNATCGNSNGSISTTVTGAAGLLNYIWSTIPVQITSSISGLASDTYTVTVTDTTGCSVTGAFLVSQPPNGMTVALTVANVLCNGQNNGSINAVPGGGSPPYTYLWGNGDTVADLTDLAAGIYAVTVHDQSGCGYILDTTVSQPAALVSVLSASVCQGNSYPFAGQNLSVAGVYSDTLTAHSGCDSIITLNLSLTSSIRYSYNQNICNGGNYNFNGRLLTAGGTYTDTLTGTNACDSIVTLLLQVTLPVTNALSATICSGSSYNFNQVTLSASGVYIDTLTTTGGCDSIVTLNLVVLNGLGSNLADTVCSGGSYTFYGSTLTASGNYTQHLTSVGGCDSLITLQLYVKPAGTPTTVFDTICPGAAYIFNGVNLSSTGIYSDTLGNLSGCDSVINLHLMVKNAEGSAVSEAICSGQVYKFNGLTLSISGQYADTLAGVNGCDSIVVLTLTVNQSPVVTWAGNPDTVQQQGPVITLSSGSPAGGTYSGQGVWNGKFYPDSVSTGTYTLTYSFTDGPGCGDSVHKTITVVTTVGIADMDMDNAIKIYPNPASDEVTVQSELFGSGPVTISLYDVTGKLIEVGYTRKNDMITLNTAALARGTYLVRVDMDGMILTRRFVKIG